MIKFSKMKNIVEEQDTYKYSCVYVMLNQKSVDIVRKMQNDFIDPEGIWRRNDEGGLETNPHATIKYGLDDASCEDMRIICKERVGKQAHKLIVSGISKFTTHPDYDVLKLDVLPTSEMLNMRRGLETFFPDMDKHPQYSPHVTLAYVKKGYDQYPDNVDDYIEDCLEYDSICFSDPNKNRSYLHL